MPLAEAAAGTHHSAKSQPNSLVFEFVVMYIPNAIPASASSRNNIPRRVKRKPIPLY